MTARIHTVVVCTLLCTVFVAPAVGAGPHTPATVGSPEAAQTGDPSAQPDPEIFVDTTSIDYGEVDTDRSASATVTVRNDGEGTLQVKDLELSGDDAFSLALDGSSSGDTGGEVATSPNFTLEPDESEQIPVVFEPSAGGAYSGTLTIDSDDPDAPTVEITLDGTGRQAEPPEIAVDRQSLTFENATVGEQSVRNVTVSNTGEGELVVDDQRIQPAGSDFEILTPLADTVAPGESDTLSVGFEPTSRNATSATLSLSTNAPGGTTVVYLSSSQATADVSVNRTENTTELTARVENATAGEAVSISVPSDPDDPAATDIDSISVTPTRDGSFDLDVASADERPADASAFEAPDATEPEGLGYLNVSHSIPNENISQATIRYRVNQSRMEELEAEPEDFSLYRRVGGTWERVDTTFDREANGTYVFSGTASGLSEWTAATEVPRISVSDATANVTAITLEESVEIQVLLNNTGGSDGRFEVELLQNGTVVERRDVAVSPETTSLVTFQRGFDQAGTYGIEVNDVFVAAIEVAEGEASVVEGGAATVETSNAGGSSGGGPGLVAIAGGFVAVGVVGLVGLGLYIRRSGGSGPDASSADSAGPPSGDGSAADTPVDSAVGDAESVDEGPDESAASAVGGADAGTGGDEADESAPTAAEPADGDAVADSDDAGGEADVAGTDDDGGDEDDTDDTGAESDAAETDSDGAAGGDTDSDDAGDEEPEP